MSQITVGRGHEREKDPHDNISCLLYTVILGLNVAPVTGENANVRPCRAISGKSICMEA